MAENKGFNNMKRYKQKAFVTAWRWLLMIGMLKNTIFEKWENCSGGSELRVL